MLVRNDLQWNYSFFTIHYSLLLATKWLKISTYETQSHLLNPQKDEHFSFNGDQIKYIESDKVWFELEISEVNTPDAICGIVVYVSWIQGHGQGLRFFDLILEISKNLAHAYNQTVQIFWETEGRQDSYKFLQTLDILKGIHFRPEGSLVNYGCRGFAYYINPFEA